MQTDTTQKGRRTLRLVGKHTGTLPTIRVCATLGTRHSLHLFVFAAAADRQSEWGAVPPRSTEP